MTRSPDFGAKGAEPLDESGAISPEEKVGPLATSSVLEDLVRR